MNRTKIYALLDPVSSEIRYVGLTHTPLNQRLASHIKSASCYPVGQWVSGLVEKGLAPTIVELEGGLSSQEAKAAEPFWIKYFVFIGANLLNRQHNGWTFGLKRRTRWDKPLFLCH